MRKKYQQFHSATMKAFKIAFVMLFLLSNCAIVMAQSPNKKISVTCKNEPFLTCMVVPFLVFLSLLLDLRKVSQTNILDAIQSFDPSFRIMDNTPFGSDPNAMPEMTIRGQSGVGNRALDTDQLSKSNHCIAQGKHQGICRQSQRIQLSARSTQGQQADNRQKEVNFILIRYKRSSFDYSK